MNEEKRKMKMRIGVLAFCSLLAFGSVNDIWPKAGKVYKVGISVWTGYPDSVRGFKEAMAISGFVEGQNVEYLFSQSALDKDKQIEIAHCFREAQVDLVYSLTTPGTIIIKEIMPVTTPIVFSIVTYPADAGLIDSFEYSGNNLIGTSNFVEFSRYVELLKTILPQAKTLAIFHRKGEPNSKIQAANMIRLLKKEGIHTLDLELETVDEMREMAIKVAENVDVFMTTTDTLCQGGGERALIQVSLEKKVPILSSNKTGIEEGSTFGPVADFYILGKMSGEMAATILKNGIKPARLQSKVQDPPLILINKRSVSLLDIEIPEGELGNFQYVE